MPRRRLDFIVRTYETDFTGDLSPWSLCNYLQEVASVHARELGLGVSKLMSQGLTWVLARLKYNLDFYPHGGKKVHVETWPSILEGVRCRREFTVFDQDGNPIGRASSVWLVVSIETKKIVRVPQIVIDCYSKRQESMLELEKPEAYPAVPPQFEKAMNAGMADVDINRHVTNNRYVQWMFDALPLDIFEKYRPVSVDVSFKAESFHADRLKVQAVLEEGEKTRLFSKVMRNGEDQRELASAVIVLEKR